MELLDNFEQFPGKYVLEPLYFILSHHLIYFFTAVYLCPFKCHSNTFLKMPFPSPSIKSP